METVIHQPGGKDIPVHIPEAENSLAERISAILQGVDKGTVDALADQLGLGKTEALKLIGIDPSTYSRSKKRLSRPVSDRVMLLKEIALVGELAFGGDMQAFHEWFRSPNVLLGNSAPMEACQFGIGVQEVQRILARIHTADFIA